MILEPRPLRARIAPNHISGVLRIHDSGAEARDSQAAAKSHIFFRFRTSTAQPLSHLSATSKPPVGDSATSKPYSSVAAAQACRPPAQDLWPPRKRAGHRHTNHLYPRGFWRKELISKPHLAQRFYTTGFPPVSGLVHAFGVDDDPRFRRGRFIYIYIHTYVSMM